MKTFIATYESPCNIFKGKLCLPATNVEEAQNKFSYGLKSPKPISTCGNLRLSLRRMRVSNTRTYIDKHCDAEARYTSEFFLSNLKVTDRSVVLVDISCFAPTRSKSKSDLRKTLQAVVKAMQKSIEDLA